MNFNLSALNTDNYHTRKLYPADCSLKQFIRTARVSFIHVSSYFIILFKLPVIIQVLYLKKSIYFGNVRYEVTHCYHNGISYILNNPFVVYPSSQDFLLILILHDRLCNCLYQKFCYGNIDSKSIFITRFVNNFQRFLQSQQLCYIANTQN